MNIRIHYTWIIVVALVTAIVTTQFSEYYPLWQRVILGGVVAILFLGTITWREWILRAVTFDKETPVKKITLFVFGGMYPGGRTGMAATHLPLLYTARFVSNLVIAAIFYGLYATFVNFDSLMMAGVAQWLAYIYFLLFLLHFVPAFPLEGGSVLRMILWRSSGNYYKATQVASSIGWVTGLILIFAGGLVFIVTLEWIISLMLICLGWILEIAAGSTRRELMTQMALQKIKAEDIMTREFPVMPQQVNIGQLVRQQILIKGWPYIIIADGTRLKGILTMNQIKSVAGKRWDNTNISDIMTPLEQLRTAHLQQTADTLYEEMHQRNIDYIPVLEEEKIVGVVNRVALMSLAKTRIGFGA